MIHEIKSRSEALSLLLREEKSGSPDIPCKLRANIEQSGEELSQEIDVLAAGTDGYWGAAFRIRDDLYVNASTERAARELLQRGMCRRQMKVASPQDWILRRVSDFAEASRIPLPGTERRPWGARLESQKDPLVEMARSLQTEKGRAEAGCYAAHGVLLAERAISAFAPIGAMLFVDRFAEGEGCELARRAAEEGIPWFVFTEGLMRKCVDSAFVPPVLTILHQNLIPAADVHIHDDFLAVLAENIEEHGNLGMILRTADAAAADLVFTAGCDPFHWRTVTGSRGSIFRVPVCTIPNSGFRIPDWAPRIQVVAAVTGTDRGYTDLDYRRPTLFLVGNETKGLSNEALEMASERITIPMPGGTDSLNVAVSASVLLYEALRQRS